MAIATKIIGSFGGVEWHYVGMDLSLEEEAERARSMPSGHMFFVIEFHDSGFINGLIMNAEQLDQTRGGPFLAPGMWWAHVPDPRV